MKTLNLFHKSIDFTSFVRTLSRSNGNTRSLITQISMLKNTQDFLSKIRNKIRRILAVENEDPNFVFSFVRHCYFHGFQARGTQSKYLLDY